MKKEYPGSCLQQEPAEAENTSHLWSAAGTGKQRDKDSLL